MRPFPTSQEILAVFEAQPQKLFRLRELVQALGLRGSQGRELKSALKELSKRKRLDLKKDRFTLTSGRRLAEAAQLGKPAAPSRVSGRRDRSITGKLIGHRDGFGFVVPDKPLAETDRDIFIPASAMKDAMHGDRVEV